VRTVLDHGYIRTVNTMGSDLDVVNAARVSFDKEANELSEKDHKLISYLVKHKHDAVFRHCAMTFEVYAPLMVARQWYKHAVASSHIEDQMGWNESSRRYVTEYTKRMQMLVKEAHDLYLEALADGVAPEQARLLLPAYSMYVRWRWTASLNALLHFISLRLDSHAQQEIQLYADAIFHEVKDAFPITTTEWLLNR
jgi:thymidylate synthase (FAD)